MEKGVRLFRKRPVVIEAWKYDSNKVMPDWLIGKSVIRHPNLEIDTLEGKMIGSPGDWIIKGVHGEVYPCKPDIFEKTYEEV